MKQSAGRKLTAFRVAGTPLLGLLVFLAMACSTGFGPTETRDDSFTVGESPRLVVNGSNGGITVTPGTDGTVRVKATLRNLDDLEYEVTQSGDTIRVEADEKGPIFFNLGQSPGADIEITAPSNARVELRTGNGAIEVYGMQQSGTLRTSNGKIVMENVSGDFDVSTSNGAVDISQAKGAFNVRTSNGRIEFNGEIAPGNNRMRTSNGSITVKLQGTPSVKLDASTSNGSIVSNVPITVASKIDEKHLVGTIGNGDAELFIETSNGSVMIQ